MSETCCSCSGRSFWEGECDYCRAHPTPRPVVDDYGASATFDVPSSIDVMVSQAAYELGWAAGNSVADIQKKAFDESR